MYFNFVGYADEAAGEPRGDRFEELVRRQIIAPRQRQPSPPLAPQAIQPEVVVVDVIGGTNDGNEQFIHNPTLGRYRRQRLEDYIPLARPQRRRRLPVVPSAPRPLHRRRRRRDDESGGDHSSDSDFEPSDDNNGSDDDVPPPDNNENIDSSDSGNDGESDNNNNPDSPYLPRRRGESDEDYNRRIGLPVLRRR
jgi:hypothetical protein